MLRPDKRRLYAPVKSTLKHPPQAYPGHLMSFAAREGGNLINLVFLGTGIWSLLIGAISFPDLLWTKPKGRSGQIQFALRDRCFHETKQTQNEVKRYLLQLGRICFRILLQQSENFSDFCKVLSQFAFRNMIVPFSGFSLEAGNRRTPAATFDISAAYFCWLLPFELSKFTFSFECC